MKKVIISLISILIIASIIGFVSATQMSKDIPGYGTIGGDFIEAGYFNFEKGWNLVHGLPNPDWLSGGDIDSSNIKAIYGFNPVTQKYVRFYPNPDKSELSSNNLRIDNLISTSSFWVYSDKKGRSEYWTLQPTPLNDKRLIRGWNFVSITPDMFNGDPQSGGTFSWNSIKGSCNFEKIYAWNPETQNWMVISAETQSNDFNDFLLSGMLIKVGNDCQLGKSEITNPPQIPDNPSIPSENNDYIITKNIDVSGDSKDIVYLSSNERTDNCQFNQGGSCKYYSGKYSYNGELEVLIVPSQIAVSEFMSKAEATYSNLQKGDFAGQDYYIYILGDDLLILWYSNGKMIFVQREPYDSTKENDYMEDFLNTYLTKYPSDLNF